MTTLDSATLGLRWHNAGLHKILRRIVPQQLEYWPVFRSEHHSVTTCLSDIASLVGNEALTPAQLFKPTSRAYASPQGFTFIPTA
jgi:hypothetical protein